MNGWTLAMWGESIEMTQTHAWRALFPAVGGERPTGRPKGARVINPSMQKALR
jgi:hypothetical protein